MQLQERRRMSMRDNKAHQLCIIAIPAIAKHRHTRFTGMTFILDGGVPA